MLKVTTTGNATLIAYDGKPVIVTDPWFGDEEPAYFGSWVLSHRIPAQLKEDIAKCEFVWFSHGHPDHLNPTSLERFRSKKILLPDHVGSRILKDLTPGGYNVTVTVLGRNGRTLVVLHGLLPHASAPNRSHRPRHAYALHIIDGRAHYPSDNWLQRPDLPLRGFA